MEEEIVTVTHPHVKPQPPASMDTKMVLERLYEGVVGGCVCGSRPDTKQLILSISLQLYHGLREIEAEIQLLWVSSLALLGEVLWRQAQRGLVCSTLHSLHSAVFAPTAVTSHALVLLLAANDRWLSYSAARALRWALFTQRDERTAVTLTTRLLDFVQGAPSPTAVAHSFDILTHLISQKEEEIQTQQQQQQHQLGSENPNLTPPPPSCHLDKVSAEHLWDTADIKSCVMRNLDEKWSILTGKLVGSLQQFNPDLESSIISFFGLWESLVSVRTNLSVEDTKIFYSKLDSVLSSLNAGLSPTVWKKCLDLFNEVLCYASTLALQDSVEEEPLHLACLVVRSAKEGKLLEKVPIVREPSGFGGRTVMDGGGARGGGAFGGVSSMGAECATRDIPGDKVLLQKLVLLVLKSVAVIFKDVRGETSSESSASGASGGEELDTETIAPIVQEVFRKLDLWIHERVGAAIVPPNTQLSRWLVRILADQDDILVEAMICTLDVHTTLASSKTPLGPALAPAVVFTHFLQTLSYDHKVLLDLLVNNETSFLLYLLRFLKYARRDWDEFKQHSGQHLEENMKLIVCLKTAIERLVAKDLFPYNIGPVVRLMEKCEQLHANR